MKLFCCYTGSFDLKAISKQEFPGYPSELANADDVELLAMNSLSSYVARNESNESSELTHSYFNYGNDIGLYTPVAKHRQPNMAATLTNIQALNRARVKHITIVDNGTSTIYSKTITTLPNRNAVAKPADLEIEPADQSSGELLPSMLTVTNIASARVMPTLNYIKEVRSNVAAINHGSFDLAINVTNALDEDNADNEKDDRRKQVYLIKRNSFNFHDNIFNLYLSSEHSSLWLFEYLNQTLESIAFFKSYGDESLPEVPHYPWSDNELVRFQQFKSISKFLVSILLYPNQFWHSTDHDTQGSYYGYYTRYCERCLYNPVRYNPNVAVITVLSWPDMSPRYNEVY